MILQEAIILRTTYISMRSKPKSRSSGASVQINLNYFKKRMLLITLGITYLAGMLVGRSLIGGVAQSNLTVANLLGNFFKSRASQNLLQNCISSFLSAELCLIILFLCGYCAIAAPLIYLTVFFRGLGPGLSLALLLSQTGWNGALAVLMMLPGIAGTAIIMILAGKVSLELSAQLFSDSGASRVTVKGVSPKYCMQFLVFTVLMILVSFLDGLLFYLFGGLLPT